MQLRFQNATELTCNLMANHLQMEPRAWRQTRPPNAHHPIFVRYRTDEPFLSPYIGSSLRATRGVMNIQNTLTVLFPAGFVIDCGPNQSGSVEVHGLPKGTVPQNCEVLVCGRSKFYWGHAHQEIYLVKTLDFLVLLRIEAAGPDSWDGEFFVSRAYAPASGDASVDFQTTARKTIRQLCGESVGPWTN